MKKYIFSAVLLLLAIPAFAASPTLPTTPFTYTDYNGLCRAAIVITAGSPTVLIVGTLGNSSNFTLATLSSSTLSATFNGVVDTITASITGGNADVTWCCSQEP
jgi:hypothetical protein